MAEPLEEAGQRHRRARREVIARLGANDARPPPVRLAHELRADAAVAVLAVHGEEAQILATGDGAAEKVAVHRYHRRAGNAVLETLLLGYAHQVVRRVVRVREELLQAREGVAVHGVHSIRKDSAHDHQLSFVRAGESSA